MKSGQGMGRVAAGTVAGLVAIISVGCQTVVPQDARSVESLESIQAALIESREPYLPDETPRDPDSMVPDIVAQALIPDLGLFSQQRTHRFDLSVQDMPATDFFMNMVQGTGSNMVVHPDVAGSISLDLKQVTIEEVMDIVRDAYDFEYRRTGNLYTVLPRGIRTEIFHINYLAVQRIGKSITAISAGSGTASGGADSSTSDANTGGTAAGAFPTNRGSASIDTGSESDFWAELKETLTAFVGSGDGRQVIVSPQTGLVVVKAMPGEIRAVSRYLDRSQLILKRQVILEAKILEVSLDDEFQSGINWSALKQFHRDKRSVSFEQRASVVPGNGVFSAVFDLGNFDAAVELLETQGTVQVLSSPRVSTVNNQKAVIKVGTDEYFVTNVSSTTTTGTSTTTTPSVDLEPFFSGIALDVTPQISDEGEIILHVHPQISQVTDQEKRVSVGSDEFIIPLAISTIRESDSIVKAQSGQVVVIGGLMENNSLDTNSGIPGARDVPLFGHLFRQKTQTQRKSELVILLRPTLTGGDTWSTSLTDSLHRYEDMGSILRP